MICLELHILEGVLAPRGSLDPKLCITSIEPKEVKEYISMIEPQWKTNTQVAVTKKVFAGLSVAVLEFVNYRVRMFNFNFFRSSKILF